MPVAVIAAWILKLFLFLKALLLFKEGPTSWRYDLNVLLWLKTGQEATSSVSSSTKVYNRPLVVAIVWFLVYNHNGWVLLEHGLLEGRRLLRMPNRVDDPLSILNVEFLPSLEFQLELRLSNWWRSILKSWRHHIEDSGPKWFFRVLVFLSFLWTPLNVSIWRDLHFIHKRFSYTSGWLFLIKELLMTSLWSWPTLLLIVISEFYQWCSCGVRGRSEESPICVWSLQTALNKLSLKSHLSILFYCI
jgi:hypothetical protein